MGSNTILLDRCLAIPLLFMSQLLAAQDLSGIWGWEGRGAPGGSFNTWEPKFTAEGARAQALWTADPLQDPGLRCVVHFGRNIFSPMNTEIIQQDDVLHIL